MIVQAQWRLFKPHVQIPATEFETIIRVSQNRGGQVAGGGALLEMGKQGLTKTTPIHPLEAKSSKTLEEHLHPTFSLLHLLQHHLS
jgi:hypothetical protein